MMGRHRLRHSEMLRDTTEKTVSGKAGQALSFSTKRTYLTEHATTPQPMMSMVSRRERKTALVALHILHVGLIRLQDPQPEGLSTRGLRAIKPGSSIWGLLPVLSLTNAVGLLVVSCSYYISQYGNLALEISFFLGLLFIFVPNMVRLLSRKPERFERLCIICSVGLSFYLVELMESTHRFTFYDEFLHLRTANDITMSRHLFSTNPLLPVSPFYPGLEIVTNALSTLTELNTYYTGVALLIVARLLIVLSLFLLYEQVTKSSRMAGIATIIYMTNPHFLFFDAMFSYETLALALAIFMLYLLTAYESTEENTRKALCVAYIVLLAVVVTHHMTDYFFLAFLLLWALISLVRPSSSRMRVNLVAITLCGTLLSLTYALLLQENPVSGYLFQYFGTTFVELGHIINGTSTTRHLFVSQGALEAPLWDRLLMMASVGLVSLGLPFGLLTLWQQHRYNALAMTFGLVSLAYPLSQAFRFTNFGSEITDRAAAFLFLPIAYVLTIFVTHFWPIRKLGWRSTSLIIALLAVIFLGGVLIEAGPAFSSLPGPYMVMADSRSVEPEGIQTALWTGSHLGPDNRVGTDRLNQLLQLSYGEQHIVTSAGDNMAISSVFLSSHIGSREIAILQEAEVRYLVVDMRMSTSLPLVGFYFEDSEPDAFQIMQPMNREDLTKFDTLPQLKRIYDSGDIVIYDVAAVTSRAGS